MDEELRTQLNEIRKELGAIQVQQNKIQDQQQGAIQQQQNEIRTQQNEIRTQQGAIQQQQNEIRAQQRAIQEQQDAIQDQQKEIQKQQGVIQDEQDNIRERQASQNNDIHKQLSTIQKQQDTIQDEQQAIQKQQNKIQEQQASQSKEDKKREFKMKEYDALRDEIKTRVGDIFKVELATLGGILAIAAWMIEKQRADGVFLLIPGLIWIIGGLAVYSKSRTIGRLSTYITLHIERDEEYSHKLWEKFSVEKKELMPLKKKNKGWIDTLLDTLSGKPNLTTAAPTLTTDEYLEGGWETWFDEQPYNYTLFQIGVWILGLVVAVFAPIYVSNGEWYHKVVIVSCLLVAATIFVCYKYKRRRSQDARPEVSADCGGPGRSETPASLQGR